MKGIRIVDAWCEHMVNRRKPVGRQRCNRVARFHYRSITGREVRLCGVHAGAQTHRWKNPRPITESAGEEALK